MWWLFAGPLNRAEWFKFLGLFFNLDSVATTIFDTLNTSYYNNKATVSPAAKRPVLAFVDLYSYPPDTAYEVSLAAYKVQYTQVSIEYREIYTYLIALSWASLA